MSLLLSGCRGASGAPGDPQGGHVQGAAARAMRGTDWRMQGLRKVIQDAGRPRASISAEKAELHGMPLLSFRFAPIKQLELRDLRVLLMGTEGLAETPSAIVDTLGPSSPDEAIAAIVVHGIEIRYPGRDRADACWVSASSARWIPGSSTDSAALALQGNVHVRIGETEQVVDAIRLVFRHTGIELYDTVESRGSAVHSPDGGPHPFCRILS